jgi:hypothetical protein
MNIRRLIGGLSFLALLVGALLLCFIPGGLVNTTLGMIHLNQAGHIFGFILLGLGAVGLVVLWSLEKKS